MIEDFQNWNAAAQAKALDMLRQREQSKWKPFYCADPLCTGQPHGPLQKDEPAWDWNHARPDQRPPKDKDWLTWVIRSGRGAGKTRTGSELAHQMSNHVGRIALIGETGADVRDTMVEGESGIMSIAPPGRMPEYIPSKRRITFASGCIATTYTAEKPNQLRGPEHGYAWLDEPAHFALIQEVWDNLLFGLRLGKRPRILVTTTPTPRPWMKNLLADPTTRDTVTSTYANIDNLAPTFRDTIIGRYENTRLGLQELHGQILDDVEGALWTLGALETLRVATHPVLERIIVGVDPAGTSTQSSDETGIVVSGRGTDGHLYVLEDASGIYTPLGWASQVDAMVRKWQADAVVAEKNFGGEMVEHTLRTGNVDARVIMVQARRGKYLRAEPLVGLYEQQKVHHVGVLQQLETQMCEWVPFEKNTKSPDRVDALVYSTAPLLLQTRKAQISSPLALNSA